MDPLFVTAPSVGPTTFTRYQPDTGSLSMGGQPAKATELASPEGG
jgi:hypothetical protein